MIFQKKLRRVNSGGPELRLENERYGDEPYGDRHFSPSPNPIIIKGVDKIFKICYNSYSKVRKEKSR